MKSEGNKDLPESESTILIQSCAFDSYDVAMNYYKGSSPVIHTADVATTNGKTTSFPVFVYPVDTKYTVKYSSKTNENFKDMTTLPVEEGDYTATFTLENGNWASDISNNNVFTTDFKVVSSLPYNEYILIESADDVEEWI